MENLKMGVNAAPQDTKECVAIVRKFKELLLREKAKFLEYEKLLTLQAVAIKNDDIEKLSVYKDLGNEITASINSLQKVVIPFLKIFMSIEKSTGAKDRATVALLQNDLYMLKSKVLTQNKLNRERLALHMATAQKRLDGFKNPYSGVSSVFMKRQATSSLIAVAQ